MGLMYYFEHTSETAPEVLMRRFQERFDGVVLKNGTGLAAKGFHVSFHEDDRHGAEIRREVHGVLATRSVLFSYLADDPDSNLHLMEMVKYLFESEDVDAVFSMGDGPSDICVVRRRGEMRQYFVPEGTERLAPY